MIDGEQRAQRLAQIRQVMQMRETDELQAIWDKHDQDEWSVEAFEVVRSLLTERTGQVPEPPAAPPMEDLTDAPHLIAQADEYLARAVRLVNEGELEKALAECKLAVMTAPHHALAHNTLGVIYDERQELDKAIAAYAEAVRLDPDLQAARNNLRDARVEQEENPSLREAVEHAEPIDTEAEDDLTDAPHLIAQADEHLARAARLISEDNLEQALTECKLAVMTAPHHAHAYNTLGVVYDEQGELDKAIAAYAKAVRLDPDLREARNNLRDARKEQGEKPSVPDMSGEDEFAEAEAPETISDAFDESETLETAMPPVYLDEKAQRLRGWPGHRTRPGRSGFDPLENASESAHMEGVFLRQLLTGQLRTRNPFYLLVMAVAGGGCLAPLVTVGGAGNMPVESWCYILPLAVLGFMVLVNLGMCLLALFGPADIDE